MIMIMENLKKLLSFLAPLPLWLRVVIAALVTVVISICVLMTSCTFVSSCGITQSVVNNIASDGNAIEMGVTPSTTTSTSTSIPLDIPLRNPIENSVWAVFLILHFIRNGKKIDESHRICVEGEHQDEVRRRVSQFFSAYLFSSGDDRLLDFDIHAIVSLPTLFFDD